MSSPDRTPSWATKETAREISSLSTNSSNEMDVEVPIIISKGSPAIVGKKREVTSTFISRHQKKIFFCVLCTLMITIGLVLMRGTRFFLGARVVTNAPTVSIVPSNIPSDSPSENPSLLPTVDPSETPSYLPSNAPSLIPSPGPSINPSEGPSMLSSAIPSEKPSVPPSLKPSSLPSMNESVEPSFHPSSSPSLVLSETPSLAPTINYFDFYVLGDIPYHKKDHDKLMYYVTKIPSDGNFIVHVGDINKAIRDGCPESSYIVSHNILKQSPVPLFITPGDNDWNKCPNPDKAWKYWMQYFERFDQNWNHTLPVNYQPDRTENVSMFIDQFGILFIVLNLVGGDVHDLREWEVRLTSQLEWTIELIEQYKDSLEYLVIFGHAVPVTKHRTYFRGLDSYLEDSGLSGMPILYTHGDGHDWEVEEHYRGHKNFLRIMVDDGRDAPPIRVRIEKGAKESFQIDQRFEMSFDEL